MRQKQILTTTLLILILASISELFSTDRTFSIQFQWYPQAQFAGYIMAQEAEIYQQKGLDVELCFFNNKEGVWEQLFSGEKDFGTAWLTEGINYASQDEDIVNIAQVLQKSSLMLVSKKESGISKPEDMNGKRVSIWGGDFSLQPNAFFRKYKISPTIVQQSYSIEMFISNAVDVASAMHYNEYHRIYQSGIDKEELNIFMFAEYGINFPEDGIYCKKQFLTENSDEVRRFVEASLLGWQYAFNNVEQSLDVIMRYCREAGIRTNRAHQKWMLNSMKSAIEYKSGSSPDEWGVLKKEEFSQVVEELMNQKVIDKKVQYKEFFWDRRSPENTNSQIKGEK